MKWKNPLAAAGCLPISPACLAAPASRSQARCCPRGFGRSLLLPGTDRGVLGGDFAGAVQLCEAIVWRGTSGKPLCPPGQVPVARGCHSAQQVRVTQRGCWTEGASAVELVLVPLPCLQPGFHRRHPLGFALPIGVTILAGGPWAQRGRCSLASASLPGQSLQKLLPDPRASAEPREQLAEPGALSGARQHEKNAGLSRRRSCGWRSRAGRWVVCLLEALLCEVRRFQEP